LRVLMLPHRGVFDMDAYVRWGTAALETGLAHAYIGVYFPLQYQIFEAAVALSRWLHVDPIVVLKAVNLAFDAGNCALLAALLRRRGLSPAYALLYWLHPWFLVVFDLGYADFHFVFFLLLTLWLLERGGETASRYAAAGVPFAAALLMKPQALMPAVAFAVYAAVRWSRTRRADAFFLFLPALVLGAAYEAYFTVALLAESGWLAAGVLPGWYLHTTSVMPVLTANMPNAWYPVAYALRQPGQDIFWVKSTIEVVPHVEIRYAALLAVLALAGGYAWRAATSAHLTRGAERLRSLLTFVAVIVPAFMTSAHENHFFLPAVLLVPVLASPVPLLARAAIHAALMIQAVNLEGTYGTDRFALWLQPRYPLELRVALAVLSTACFVVIARELYRAVGPREPIVSKAGA